MEGQILSSFTNPLVGDFDLETEMGIEKPRSDGRPSRKYYSLRLFDPQDPLTRRPHSTVVFQQHFVKRVNGEDTISVRWGAGDPGVMKAFVGKTLPGFRVVTVETPDYEIESRLTGMTNTVNKTTLLVPPGQKLDDIYEAWKARTFAAPQEPATTTPTPAEEPAMAEVEDEGHQDIED